MRLLPKLNHAWRVLATGISFAVFGLGGVLLSVTLFPLAAAFSPDAATTRSRVQRLMHRSWRVFIGFMRVLGILTWELRGGERLTEPGRLIVANHPSLLDVVFLIAFTPEVDCVVKPAIFANRFMRLPARWAGYIAEHSPEQLVEDCAATLKRGRSLLIFPEGTRSRPGQPLRLRRGAAQIALACGRELLPVTLQVAPPTLTKGEPWYRVPPRPFHVRIEVGEPWRLDRYLGLAPSVAARHLTQDLTEYFERRLAAMDPPPAPGPAAV